MPDGKPRGGLPKWLGAQVSSVTQSEMRLMYGEDHLVFGQAQAIELLIDGADWKVSFSLQGGIGIFTRR